MKFELEKHHRHVPDEDLISDLKRVASDLIKDKVTADEYNEHGNYHNTTLTRRFGSWFKALEKAGLRKTRNLNISNEDLFSNLMDVWTKLERQPKYNDMTSMVSKYAAGTYEYRFGTWRKALETFVKYVNEGNIEPPSSNKSKKKTKTHKTSRTINHRLRFLVMRRDNFKCCLTGKSPATDPSVILWIDHIDPWDNGGETVMENLQTICKDLNIGKSNLSMDENEDA